jgi:plasmid stabilization system protein ParE
MRIRWTVPAADDLENIKNYLQRVYRHFAEPTVRTIYQRIRSLKAAPHQGRPGHRSGTKNCRLRRFHMLSSIQLSPRLSKSCTSITVHKTGVEQALFCPGLF